MARFTIGLVLFLIAAAWSAYADDQAYTYVRGSAARDLWNSMDVQDGWEFQDPNGVVHTKLENGTVCQFVDGTFAPENQAPEDAEVFCRVPK